MAERGGLVRVVVMGVCIGVTALGLANTYGDNADVIERAQAAACGSKNCAFQTLRQERSPFAQKFTFQVTLTERGKTRGATSDVECTRAYVLLGDYRCKQTSGGLPGGSASAP